MDRFIVPPFKFFYYVDSDLKSNMDRFIVPQDIIFTLTESLFKIQYG